MAGPEIIGTVAAVMQLTKYAARMNLCFTELAKKARNQSEILEELAEQVECIITSAQSIALASSQTCTTRPITRRCIDKATALQRLLTKWQVETPGDGTIKKKSKILVAATTWYLKEREITNLWKEIHQSMVILNFQASRKVFEKEMINSAMLCVGGPSSSSSNTQNQSVDIESVVYPITMMLMDSTLPSRNKSFVGRETLLFELEQRQKSGPRIALVGLGGIGKSQLAVEYAHRYRKELQRSYVFFAYASSETHLEKSYSRFATDARLTTLEAPWTSKCQAVKFFFDSDQSAKWLMIIDGADDIEAFFGPKEFHRFLPQRDNGLVIFTTRSLQVALDLGCNLDEVIYVTRFTPNNAVEMLQSRLGDSKGDSQSILELFELLDGLPLALSQAASFIATNCKSVQEYIDLYQENENARIYLLGKGKSHRDGSEVKSVATTWQVSFERIKRSNNSAAHLLCLAACLDYHQIPTEIFPKSESRAQLIDALGILKGHCLITMCQSADSFDTHRLVHLMTRDWLRSENQFERYIQLAFDSIYECFPLSFQGKDIVHGDRYSVHAQTVLHDLSSDQCDERHAKLASRLSRYLRVKGDYRNALEYARMAVNLSVTACGQLNVYTLTTQSDLAITYWYLGEYQEAERLAADVLRSRREMLGSEHVDTLASSNNLALIVHDQGDYETAEQLHRKTLETRIKVLGPRHDDTMRSLNNLGLSLKELERYEEAKELFQRALTEREDAVGKIDISTLKVMDNLGLILQIQNKCEEASWYHSESLEGRRLLLGSNHPDTLKSKHNFAIVLMSQDRLEEAELMMREVLDKYKQVLGKEHPTTLYAQSNLAIALRNRGRYREATSHSRQVLKARKVAFGEGHPETIYSAKQYRSFVELMGESREPGRDDENTDLDLD